MEQRIRKILSAKGLKMSDLANRVGMGQSNLVKSIKSNPKLSTLEDICVALGIEMTELLGGKEEKSDGVIVLNGETYTLYKPKTRTAQIKVYNDYQELRSNIRDFVKRSLKTKELGSIAIHSELKKFPKHTYSHRKTEGYECEKKRAQLHLYFVIAV